MQQVTAFLFACKSILGVQTSNFLVDGVGRAGNGQILRYKGICELIVIERLEQ
jgi:hypothetical protein